MLRKWILSARRKPKHVRNNIAFGIAGSFTAFLFVVWLVVMPGKIVKETATKDVQDNKAFSTFVGQLKEQIAGVKEAIPEAPATSTAATKNSITELTATSSTWTLSSTTVEAKSIPKEVPIVVVSSGSSTTATTTAETNP